MERLTERTVNSILIKGCKTIFAATKRKKAHMQNAIVKLAAYEDTGLEPEEIKTVQDALTPIPFSRYREIMEAERAGRLVVLPFVAMVEQSLRGGEMTPQRDQRFNGRYAVVYFDPKKWQVPLIDICGEKKYDRIEADERLAELTRQEAEEALRKEEKHEVY